MNLLKWESRRRIKPFRYLKTGKNSYPFFILKHCRFSQRKSLEKGDFNSVFFDYYLKKCCFLWEYNNFKTLKNRFDLIYNNLYLDRKSNNLLYVK